MRHEFTWLNRLLILVSVVGYAIFLAGLIFFTWGIGKYSSDQGTIVSALDLTLIGLGGISGLVVGTTMQVFRIAVSLNDKAIKVMEQLELMDVRIRSVVPQNRQLKQLDALPDLVEVSREMLESLKALHPVPGEVQKAMESIPLENGSAKQNQEKSLPPPKDPLALLQDDSKWKCPHCSAENPIYLFKCRECGQDNLHI